MNVTILGASGGCGQALVDQAVERGHVVTAVVRSPAYRAPAAVRTLVGDLTSADFLRSAVRGSDVVFSALGLRMQGMAPWNRPPQPDFLERSTPALVSAAKAENVTRLLAISAAGVGDSFAQMPSIFRLVIKHSGLKHVYPELEKMERVLLQSGLDVCICRPTGLTDGPRLKQVVVCRTFTGRATISRADVAWWMLEQAAAPSFSERTPIITTTGA
ncbi:MAG: NAD(P)H-binding protein [Archangium sp.]|nr:NAD(P)H-binding protein [Archangium sp.]